MRTGLKHCLIIQAAAVLFFALTVVLINLEKLQADPESPETSKIFIFEPVPYPKTIPAEEDPSILEYAFEVFYIIDGKPHSVFARSEAERDRLLNYLEALR